MNKIFSNIFVITVLTGILLTAYPAPAQRKTKVTKKHVVAKKKDQDSSTTPVVIPNRTTQNLLTRIETNTGIYRRELTRALGRSNLQGSDSEVAITAYIADFENATKTLRTRVDTASDSVSDVQDVLNRAEFIQSFQRDNPLTPAVQSQWKLLTDNLVTLANTYKVSWNINTNPTLNNQTDAAVNQTNPNNQTYSNNQGNNPNNQPRNNYAARFDSMLTGTYRLNVSQSDNVGSILDKTLNTPNTNNQINNQTTGTQDDRIRRSMERRLASPEMFVIEKSNTAVTIASNLSPQVTVTADNVARSEISPNGRTVNVKAGTISNALEISYQGDRVNDFFLTFMPVQNQQLRVTRRLYFENQDRTVTVTSIYDKILPTADFTVVNTNQNRGQSNSNNPTNPTNSNRGVSNDYIITNGTQLIGVLNTAFSTQNVREGERFAIAISEPSQYAGAIIEGYLTNTQSASGVSNRAQITFNLDTIKLRNGRSYSFGGLIDVVRLPNGTSVSLINSTNQPRPQTTRPSVGGSLGAILGAIFTGGQNLPSDAAVNGSEYGSGTIILEGQNNIDLASGTQFRITSVVPANSRVVN